MHSNWKIWNNLEARDPAEIERTYNIRKQQTRFYWVCSWELMESGTILTPPSTGLSGNLLSTSSQYSWRIRTWKNINTIPTTTAERASQFWARCMDIIQMVLTLITAASKATNYCISALSVRIVSNVLGIRSRKLRTLCNLLHCWICLIQTTDANNFWNEIGLVCHNHWLFAWEILLQTINPHAKSHGDIRKYSS